MPAVFTGLQAPSLLKIKSVRVVTTLIVHKSLICLMLRCLEFEFSNVSSQPLQINSKFCCNEMNLLVVVLRQKNQTIKQNKHTICKKKKTKQTKKATKQKTLNPTTLSTTKVKWQIPGLSGNGRRVGWLLDAFLGQGDLETGTAKINNIPDLFNCLP